MVTTPEEYYAQLYLIQSQNPPKIAILPTAENTYNVDLESRKIETPEFLSVEHDHQSETIYFKIDRFFDYMDLSTTTCIIQYINAAGEARIYAVPFFDIVTCATEDKMLFPWCIDGMATAAAGPVQYSIRFYKLDPNGKKFIYNLNTLTATSEVKYGMNVQELNPDYDIPATPYQDLLDRIAQIEKMDIYWIEV